MNQSAMAAFVLNSEQRTDSTSVPNTSASQPPNPDGAEKLNALVETFAKRGAQSDGLPALLLGTLPMLRMQVRKIDPLAVNALAQFLGDAFTRIGDDATTLDTFNEWLSELAAESA